MWGRATPGNPRSRALAAILVCLGASICANAPGAPAGAPLAGNVHQMSQSRYDRGAVPISVDMTSLELVLRRSPASEAALAALLAAQQDPRDAHYHAWLSPAEFGARFGADPNRIAALTAWLRAQGFQVGRLSPGRTRLGFRGSVGQVEAAFHTAIHYFEVDGARHYANTAAPQIPVEFSPLIRGIRGLHDFAPHAGAHARSAAASHDYVGPADFARIYDLAPLYANALSGTGVTIAIVAQSDFDPSIPQAYWAATGVAAGQQIKALQVPGGSDPGRTGDDNEDEVYLDLEIAGGLAPGAHLVVVSDSNAINAAEYAVDQNLAAILNVSFGSCEAADGTANATVSDLWQQAVAQGMTIVVAAGDAGAAACDDTRGFTPGSASIEGLAVNGLASPPAALAVGGTDFDPTNALGTLANAQSYIAEMVWNDGCTNSMTALHYGYASALGFCNATSLGTTTPNPYLQLAAGGGGLSSCSVQSVSGACVSGYAAPAWQSGVAGIGDWTVRALPDIAMLATSWLLCSYESASEPCSPGTGKFLVSGGTSAAAPAIAAILALLDQSKISVGNADGRQGLVAPMLYSLASLEYGTSTTPNVTTSSQCNASQGAAGGTGCVFHDITVGTNAVPCSVAGYLGSAPGSLPAGSCVSLGSDAFGILSTGGGIAYSAGSGYDLASGLGSIDAANLVDSTRPPAPPTALAATSTGTSVTLTWDSAARASSYDIYAGAASGQEGKTPVQTAITGTSATLSGLSYGSTYYFTVTAVSAYGSSTASSEAAATIVPAPPTAVNASAAGSTITLSWSASSGATAYEVLQMTGADAATATPVKTGLTTTSTAISGLAPGTDYSFAVVADNAAGTSAASPAASAVIPPEAPTNLAATAGNGTVSLSWTAAGGASTYTLYSGNTAGGESTTALQSGITTTTTSVPGLSNGKAYFFRVVAVNAGGDSGASNEVSATPTAPSKGGGALEPWNIVALIALAGLRLRVPRINRQASTSSRTQARLAGGNRPAERSARQRQHRP
jgi:subtilase family serine protease